MGNSIQEVEDLLETARAEALAANHSVGIRRAKQALRRARKLENEGQLDRLQMDARMVLGRLLAEAGWSDPAWQHLYWVIDHGELDETMQAILALLDINLSADSKSRIQSRLLALKRRIKKEIGKPTQDLRDRMEFVQTVLDYSTRSADEAVEVFEYLLGSSCLTPSELVRVRFRLAKAVRSTESAFASLQELERARVDAEELGDRRMVLDAERKSATYLIEEGRNEEAREVLIRVSDELIRGGLLCQAAQALNLLGEVERFTGNLTRARMAYRQTLQLWQQLGIWEAGTLARMNLVMTCLEERKISEATKHQDELMKRLRDYPKTLRHGTQLLNMRLLFMKDEGEKGAQALSDFLDDGGSCYEADDADIVEWVVERIVELPEDRRPKQALFDAAKALSAAESVWHLTDRVERFGRVEELRDNIARLLE